MNNIILCAEYGLRTWEEMLETLLKISSVREKSFETYSFPVSAMWKQSHFVIHIYIFFAFGRLLLLSNAVTYNFARFMTFKLANLRNGYVTNQQTHKNYPSAKTRTFCTQFFNLASFFIILTFKRCYLLWEILVVVFLRDSTAPIAIYSENNWINKKVFERFFMLLRGVFALVFLTFLLNFPFRIFTTELEVVTCFCLRKFSSAKTCWNSDTWLRRKRRLSWKEWKHIKCHQFKRKLNGCQFKWFLNMFVIIFDSPQTAKLLQQFEESLRSDIPGMEIM